MIRRPVTEVLVKPAGPDCNLDCDYYFYTGKSQMFAGGRTRMSEMVLESMIGQLMAQPVPQISIGWQGGEPTLMGLPFYRKALDLMQRHGRGQAVANGLQTNGLLINKAWAKLFQEYHFLVGLSLDGLQHVHDHYRRNRGGAGSWKKAVNAAHRLLDQDVEIDAQDRVRPASFSVPAQRYRNFLCMIFDLWLADYMDGAPTTSIRFFEALLFQYAGFPPTEFTLLEACGNTLLVEHTGDVYVCDFFVEPEWKLGNLLETPLDAMLISPPQLEFGQRKARLPENCTGCERKNGHEAIHRDTHR